MKQEQFKIKDKSGDREFFTIVPNYILNHSTANDQALYLQMKKFAGEEGKCFATSETLMKQLGIGRKAFNKALNYIIENKWIDYIGITEGKTRPIKTYKINNIWHLNSGYYKKISSERTLSIKKDKSQESKDTSQKNTKIPLKRTVEEEPVLIRTINKENSNEVAGLNEIIDLFKNVNPSYEKFFRNTTQRGALERLVKKFGLEKVEEIINILPITNTKKYAPTITTPLQLEDKLGQLVAFTKKKDDNKSKAADLRHLE